MGGGGRVGGGRVVVEVRLNLSGRICQVASSRCLGNLSRMVDSVQNALFFLVGAIQIVWLPCGAGHRPFKTYTF